MSWLNDLANLFGSSSAPKSPPGGIVTNFGRQNPGLQGSSPKLQGSSPKLQNTVNPQSGGYNPQGNNANPQGANSLALAARNQALAVQQQQQARIQKSNAIGAGITLSNIAQQALAHRQQQMDVLNQINQQSGMNPAQEMGLAQKNAGANQSLNNKQYQNPLIGVPLAGFNKLASTMPAPNKVNTAGPGADLAKATGGAIRAGAQDVAKNTPGWVKTAAGWVNTNLIHPSVQTMQDANQARNNPTKNPISTMKNGKLVTNYGRAGGDIINAGSLLLGGEGKLVGDTARSLLGGYGRAQGKIASAVTSQASKAVGRFAANAPVGAASSVAGDIQNGEKNVKKIASDAVKAAGVTGALGVGIPAAFEGAGKTVKAAGKGVATAANKAQTVGARPPKGTYVSDAIHPHDVNPSSHPSDNTNIQRTISTDPKKNGFTARNLDNTYTTHKLTDLSAQTHNNVVQSEEAYRIAQEQGKGIMDAKNNMNKAYDQAYRELGIQDHANGVDKQGNVLVKNVNQRYLDWIKGKSAPGATVKDPVTGAERPATQKDMADMFNNPKKYQDQFTKETGTPPLKNGLGRAVDKLKQDAHDTITGRLDSLHPFTSFVKGTSQEAANRDAQTKLLGQNDRVKQFVKDVIQPAYKGVKDKQALDRYLVAQNDLHYTEKGMKGSPQQKNAQDILKDIESHPEADKIKAAAQQIYDSLHQKAKEYEDAGMLQEGTADRWKAESPNYLPTRRVFDEAEKTSSGASGGNGPASVKNQNAIKERTGSERAIQDPLQSIIEHLHTMEATARRNELAHTVIEAGKEQGIFHPATGAPGEHTISRFVNGKEERWAAPKHIAEAADKIGADSAIAGVRALSKGTRLFRILTTDNPAFVTVHVLRDAQRVYKTTGTGPIDSLVKGIAHVLGRSEDLKDFKRYYAKVGFGNPVDAAKNKITAADVRGRGVKVVDPRTIYHKWEAMNQEALQTARVGVFVTKTKEYVAQGMSKEEAMLKAAHDAQESAGNFGRHGSAESTRMINALYAYANARAQGMASQIKAAKKEPLGYAGRVATSVVAPSLLLYQWNRQFPGYNNPAIVPQSDKDNNFILMSPDGQHYIKVPKDEAGKLGNVVEAYLTHEDKKGSGNLSTDLKKALGTANPVSGQNALPTALAPIGQVATNKNSFGSPIVPANLQSADPGKQASQGTQAIYRAVGEKLGVSPNQVKAIMEGYGSTTMRLIADKSQGLFSKDLRSTSKDNSDNLNNIPFVDRLAGGRHMSDDQGHAIAASQAINDTRNQLSPSEQKVFDGLRARAYDQNGKAYDQSYETSSWVNKALTDPKNANILEKWQQMQQNIARATGQPVPPKWSLPVNAKPGQKNLVDYLTFESHDATQRKGDMILHPWLKGVITDQTAFDKAHPYQGQGNADPLSIQPPQFSKQTQAWLDQYSKAKDAGDTATATQLLKDHPELGDAFRQLEISSNHMDQYRGNLPRYTSPEPSPEVKSWMSEYNALPASKTGGNTNPLTNKLRSQWITNNQDKWNAIQQYYTQDSAYQTASNAALAQYKVQKNPNGQGFVPQTQAFNQAALKGVSNMSQDISSVKDATGKTIYSLNDGTYNTSDISKSARSSLSPALSKSLSGYEALPKGSQARKDYLKANPSLLSYFQQRYGSNSGGSSKYSSSRTNGAVVVGMKNGSPITTHSKFSAGEAIGAEKEKIFQTIAKGVKKPRSAAGGISELKRGIKTSSYHTPSLKKVTSPSSHKPAGYKKSLPKPKFTASSGKRVRSIGSLRLTG